MAFIKKDCLNCGVKFDAEIREVNRGNGKFCSRTCSGQYKSEHTIPQDPNIECAYCGIKFYLNSSKQKGSRSGLFFCCREHKDKAQELSGIKAIHPPHFGNGTRSYREITFRIKPKVCERCGYDKNEAAIIVHHKDRNRNNNDISNLEVLCCNCHAIEHWGE